MKIRLGAVVAALLLLAACGNGHVPAPPEGPAQSLEPAEGEETGGLPAVLCASYYGGQGDPAYEYFQHKSIQRFLAMWVKEATGDIDSPQWDLASFAAVHVLDRDLAEMQPEEALYSCTFSDGAGRYGYAIVGYDGEGPSLHNWEVAETTPCPYDLAANSQAALEALQGTELDLGTTEAARVCMIGGDPNQADQGIRFTDEAGVTYIGFFGDGFTLEKQ